MRHRVMQASTAIIAAMLSLVACAEPQDPAWNAVEARVKVCREAAVTDPALREASRRLSFVEPSPAQRADRGFPNESEGVLLARLHGRIATCWKLRQDAAPALRPLMQYAYTAHAYQAGQVINYLVDRAISFGEANRLLAEAAEAAEALRTRERAYLTHSHEARQRASYNLDQSLQRAHRAPTPLPGMTCEWEELSLAYR
jgi:hypothetical protein